MVAEITNIRNDVEHFEFDVNGTTWRMRDKSRYPVVKTAEWIREYFADLLFVMGEGK